MDHLEVIIGRTATLRLSLGTARLLYRGILALSQRGGRDPLPESVRAYLERRRALLGCPRPPVDLPQLLAGDMDGHAQRSLAAQVRHITMSASRVDSDTLSLNPAARIRFLAALIEVYRLLCANLPVDLTLPPPVGLSLSQADWQLIALERERLRAESDEVASRIRQATIAHVVSAPTDARSEFVHREISAIA